VAGTRSKILTAFTAVSVAACSGGLNTEDAAAGGQGAGPAPSVGGTTDPGTTISGAGAGPVTIDPTTGMPVVDPADPNAAGPMPLRRLNRREYNNTVRDLLGLDLQPANEFPVDRDSAFGFPRSGIMATLDAELLQTAAEDLAAAADIGALVGCDVATGDEACARAFIESFGLKAYRRPLVTDEIDRLIALFSDVRTVVGLSFEDSVRAVLEGILQSPAFLYRWELGNAAPTMEGAVAKLNGYEMASRLSYFLWRTMPDQTLLDAAAAGALASEEQVRVQTERLIADVKGRVAIASFFNHWLATTEEEIAFRDKSAELYPEFDATLQAAMAAETEAFAANVVFDGDGTFTSLLTSTASSAEGPLATLYGATGGSLDPAQRAGILTRASFLAVTGASDGSHPVKRGIKIYRDLMCKQLIPPPGVEIPPPAPASAGGTTRERFAQHAENECATCHVVIDPLGFAFEHYDGIGRYRDTDNGGAVDSSSSTTLDGVAVQFNDAVGLSQVLASSSEVQSCFARQWARYALDRVDVDLDQGSIAAARQTFIQGGLSIRALIGALATSRTFRYRSLSSGEAIQ
jgi:hypothetical protein